MEELAAVLHVLGAVVKDDRITVDLNGGHLGRERKPGKELGGKET
jgi:hypothetical protein